jgi:hypothetical protein
MSRRKPKLPLLYVEEQRALWLRAVTATVERNAAAVYQGQWQSSYIPSLVPPRFVSRGRLH